MNTLLNKHEIKKEIFSLKRRNILIDAIIEQIDINKNFLLIGHKQPDEDCIASLVSMALLIKKFKKEVSIFVQDNLPEQISYLQNICTYNKIELIQDYPEIENHVDCFFVLDTPKPNQIAANDAICSLIQQNALPIIEIDHHLNADAVLIGNPHFSLVTRATSTCELIAIICCKLAEKQTFLENHGITELFSRNLVLTLITGIVGDTWFGLTAKKPRDRFFYNYFTEKFSEILKEKAHSQTGNYISINDIFKDLQSFTQEEREVYHSLLSKAHYYKQTGYLLLNEQDSFSILKQQNYSLFIKVIKAVTNFLAEKSGRFGVTAFYDLPNTGDLIQFRVRLAKNTDNIDLRKLLNILSITDGGGHPGAIGFRCPQNSIPDIDSFFKTLLTTLETL